MRRRGCEDGGAADAAGGGIPGPPALFDSYMNLERVADYCENNHIQYASAGLGVLGLWLLSGARGDPRPGAAPGGVGHGAEAAAGTQCSWSRGRSRVGRENG